MVLIVEYEGVRCEKGVRAAMRVSESRVPDRAGHVTSTHVTHVRRRRADGRTGGRAVVSRAEMGFMRRLASRWLGLPGLGWADRAGQGRAGQDKQNQPWATQGAQPAAVCFCKSGGLPAATGQ